MIIVDETLPIGDLPPPFPKENVKVKFDEDMKENYDLKQEIGRGRFGTVYLCSCKKNGIKFAAKFVNTKRNQDRENVEREIEIMKILNDETPHPKLIQLYDAYDMGKEMCLVLEVVNGGELFERVIDDDFVLTERACAIFIRQIVQGIEFIHSKNVLHLDMKPENILCLSREGNRVKICDFGLARKYDPRKKLQVLFGTPEFVAPEVVNFEPISFGTDLWSVGVICYVLLSGLSPFMGHNYVETMTNVTHNKYDFDDEVFDEVSDEVKDFIERLLVLDKSARLSPAECLGHKWMTKALADDAPRRSIIGASTSSLFNIESNDNTTEELTSISDDSLGLKSEENIIVGGKLDIQLTNNAHAVVNEIMVNIATEVCKAPITQVEQISMSTPDGISTIMEKIEDKMETTNEDMYTSVQDNVVTHIENNLDTENLSQAHMSCETLDEKEYNSNTLQQDENCTLPHIGMPDTVDSYHQLKTNNFALVEDQSTSDVKKNEEETKFYNTEVIPSSIQQDSHYMLKEQTDKNVVSAEKSSPPVLYDTESAKRVNVDLVTEKITDRVTEEIPYAILKNKEVTDVISKNEKMTDNVLVTQPETNPSLEIKNIQSSSINKEYNERKLDENLNISYESKEKNLSISKTADNGTFNGIDKSLSEAKSLYDSIFNAPKEEVNKKKTITTTGKNQISANKSRTTSPKSQLSPKQSQRSILVETRENNCPNNANKIPDAVLSGVRLDIKMFSKNKNQLKNSKDKVVEEKNSAIDKITDRIRSPEAIADAKSLYDSLFNAQSTVSVTDDEEKCNNIFIADQTRDMKVAIVKEQTSQGSGTSLKRENSNKRKKRDFTEELELTKRHLREFVERWNSHPNSPYIIDSPKLPSNLGKNENYYSRASIASIDVAPPSDMMDLSDFEDDLDEDFACYKIAANPKPDVLPPGVMAKELESRLELLQQEENKTPVKNDQIKSFQNEILKHPEVRALQREAAGAIQSRKVDKKEIPKESLKRSDNVKMRPSRDVMVKDQILGHGSQTTTPEFRLSRSSTPHRRSRKQSREDRAHSRESEGSTPVKNKRRPSRDVPMSTSQLERLNAITGTTHKSRTSTLELWPDMVCLTNKAESDYHPITAKLELPMKAQEVNIHKNVPIAETKNSRQETLKKVKSCDDQEIQGCKTIVWAIDLDTPIQMPLINSFEDSSDNTPVMNKSSLSPARNAISITLSKSPSSSSMHSFEGLSINTPWGLMKRSPSKNCMKSSDNTTIINIKDCFTNTTNNADNSEIEHSRSFRNPLTEIENYPIQICSSYNERSDRSSGKNNHQEIPVQQQVIPNNGTNFYPSGATQPLISNALSSVPTTNKPLNFSTINSMCDKKRQIIKSSNDNNSGVLINPEKKCQGILTKKHENKNEIKNRYTIKPTVTVNNAYQAAPNMEIRKRSNDASDWKTTSEKKLQTRTDVSSAENIVEKHIDKIHTSKVRAKERKKEDTPIVRVRKRPTSSIINDKGSDLKQNCNTNIEQMEALPKRTTAQKYNNNEPNSKTSPMIIDTKTQTYKSVPQTIKIEMQNCVSNLGNFLGKSISSIKCEKPKEIVVNKSKVQETIIPIGLVSVPSTSQTPCNKKNRTSREVQPSPIVHNRDKEIKQITIPIVKEVSTKQKNGITSFKAKKEECHQNKAIINIPTVKDGPKSRVDLPRDDVKNDSKTSNKLAIIIPTKVERSRNSLSPSFTQPNLNLKVKMNSPTSSSELLPKPPDQQRTTNLRSESKKNSSAESGDETVNNTQRRCSKPKPPPTVQRPIGLYSAQDRIFQFEQKREENHFNTIPRCKSHASINPALSASTLSLDSKNKLKRTSICERSSNNNNNIAPSIMCSKSNCNVKLMRSKYLLQAFSINSVSNNNFYSSNAFLNSSKEREHRSQYLPAKLNISRRKIHNL